MLTGDPGTGRVHGVLTPCRARIEMGGGGFDIRQDRLHRASPAVFDPARAVREFRIASTDYGALAVVVALASALALALAAAAPHTTLTIDPWNENTLTGLERGDLDLALYADDVLPPDFHARDLFQESYALIVRRGHPLARSRLRGAALIARAAGYSQVVARCPSGRTFGSDDVLAKLGAPTHHIALALPYFLIAPLIVAESDMVMVLPRRVAIAVGQVGRPLFLDLHTAPDQQRHQAGDDLVQWRLQRFIGGRGHFDKGRPHFAVVHTVSTACFRRGRPPKRALKRAASRLPSGTCWPHPGSRSCASIPCYQNALHQAWRIEVGIKEWPMKSQSCRRDLNCIRLLVGAFGEPLGKTGRKSELAAIVHQPDGQRHGGQSAGPDAQGQTEATYTSFPARVGVHSSPLASATRASVNGWSDSPRRPITEK